MTETDYAVAPGAYLEEWVDDRRLSRRRVADLLDYSPDHVDRLMNGRAPITREVATRLELVTGIPVRAWLTHEALYRADLARLADGRNRP